MVRAVHDMFAKEWMKELLADFGEVKVERPVSSEVRTIDLVFYPNQEKLESLTALGLLGKMLTHHQTKDLREVMMNLAPAYEQWYAKTIAEGEQRGEVRGELVRSTEIARRMLSKNMSLQEIAEFTELTIEQLKMLQAEA
jgi:predicted transposase/invertase (TIGR01784 family)